MDNDFLTLYDVLGISGNSRPFKYLNYTIQIPLFLRKYEPCAIYLVLGFTGCIWYRIRIKIHGVTDSSLTSSTRQGRSFNLIIQSSLIWGLLLAARGCRRTAENYSTWGYIILIGSDRGKPISGYTYVLLFYTHKKIVITQSRSIGGS